MLVDGIHEGHSSDCKLLSLTKGVVFVKFSEINPFIHDGFVLKEGCGSGEEIRELDGCVFIMDKFFVTRYEVPCFIGHFS